MESIQEYIKSIPSHRQALITKDRIFTFRDLRDIHLHSLNSIKKLSSSNVVINSKNSVEFIILLSSLDGFVGKILFVPNDISKELRDKYCSDNFIEYEVSLENNILVLNKIGDYDIGINNYTETKWLIPTSGTTSDPKLISHTLKSLTRTSKKDISIGLKYIWGLTFDTHRFSGIQVILQSILSGSSIIIPKKLSNLQQVVDLFLENKCNVISATPSFWRKLLMIENAKKIGLKRATLGGEISDQTILNVLKKTYNKIKITHIYASTEIGVGFAVSDGNAGFPISFVSIGINDLRLKIDKNSLLWIKNERKQLVSSNLLYDSEGYVNTGDLVKIKGNRVYFIGRQSGLINIGGNKVYPEEVEEKILASGLVHSVYVYPRVNSIIGSLVCADIVPNRLDLDNDDLKKRIFSFCNKNLEPFKVPAFINIVNELEINHNGKVRRSLDG